MRHTVRFPAPRRGETDNLDQRVAVLRGPPGRHRRGRPAHARALVLAGHAEPDATPAV